MDVTDVVGGFGPWQRVILLVIIYRAMPLSFIASMPIFYVATTDHWCASPKNLVWPGDEWRETAIPIEGQARSKCHQYDVFYEEGQLLVDTNRTVPCKAWEFDNEYGKTLISEFNLVCEDAWKISLTHTALKIGNMVAFLPGGQLTDRFGRKRVAMWSLGFQLISSTVAAFSPSYNFYLVVRFLVGVFYGTTVTASLCLLLESLGPSHRYKISFSFIGGWGVGLMLVPAVYWLDQNWRHSQLITSIPFNLVLMGTLWWFVPESPRWLLTVNRDKEAQKIIFEAARKNKVTIQDRDAVMKELKKKIQDDSGKVRTGSLFDLFRSREIRKFTLVLYILYFLTAFVYFGFTLTIQSLGASLYLTVFLMGLAEILAVALFTPISLYCRRRPSLVALSFTTAACYLAAIPVPDDMIWLRLTLTMLGRWTNIVIYNLMWMVSAEIYPTSHRSIGVNGCMTVGRIGTIFSTFLVSVTQTANKGTWLLVVFGVLVGLGGLLYLVLPETKDRHLPDTLSASKKLAANNCLDKETNSEFKEKRTEDAA